MKITDAMRRKAVEAIARGYGEKHVIDVVLEAALADVPEPQLGQVCFTAPERLWDERIAALEAKLAKVREAVEDASMDDAEARLFVAGALDDRVAILDGEAGA